MQKKKQFTIQNIYKRRKSLKSECLTRKKTSHATWTFFLKYNLCAFETYLICSCRMIFFLQVRHYDLQDLSRPYTSKETNIFSVYLTQFPPEILPRSQWGIRQFLGTLCHSQWRHLYLTICHSSQRNLQSEQWSFFCNRMQMQTSWRPEDPT